MSTPPVYTLEITPDIIERAELDSCYFCYIGLALHEQHGLAPDYDDTGREGYTVWEDKVVIHGVSYSIPVSIQREIEQDYGRPPGRRWFVPGTLILDALAKE